ncbi:MAG: hypothetical protein WB588_11125 [Dehalococcoidia bacterium]
MLYRFAASFCAIILLALAAAPAFAQDEPIPGPIGGESISVSTSGATSVTESSAVLNGYLGSIGPYSTVEVFFETSDGQSTSRQMMSGPGSFSIGLTGLSSGTSYSFHAVAMSSLLGGQRAEGVWLDFTTQHTIPSAPIQISTSSASDITSSTATLRGYLSGMGPYNTVTVYFQWGNNPAMQNSTGSQVMYGPGSFSIPVSGLAPNTTYYFQAVGKPDVIGVAPVYGDSNSFYTSGGGTLSVSTGAQTGVTATSATVNGYLDSLGNYGDAYVWFEWGTSTGYGQTTGIQTLYSAGTFSTALQGLNPGTLYHFRALAAPSTAGGVTVHGFDGVFTTSFSPGGKVSTSSASNIGQRSATLNGFLTSTGSSPNASVWFEYGTDTTFGYSTPQQNINNPGSFSFNIGGLQPGFTYYYRAVAIANGNNSFGQYSVFQTAGSVPVNISTNAASSIATNIATLNGYISSIGTLPSVQVWFNYGTTPGYGKITTYQTINMPQGFSAQITGLNPGIDYYFQAVAQTPDGTKVYGSQQVFSTVSNSSISVITASASSITASTAVLNGGLSNLGNTPYAQVWFEYGTTADFGNSTDLQQLNGPGNFSSAVAGLAPGRTYYYHAAALNPTGGSRSVYGAATSFSTPGSGSGPGPGPTAGIPVFIWVIMGVFLILIFVLILLLAMR